MHIVNKNKILDVYYNEASSKDKTITQNHINECNLCAEYYESLFTIEKKLNYLTESEPDEMVLTNILGNIGSIPHQKIQPKIKFSAIPFFEIAFGIVFILAVIYIIGMKLTLLPFWQSIEKHWLVQTFGSNSIPFIIVLLIGTFITLALAPILIFESRNNKNFT